MFYNVRALDWTPGLYPPVRRVPVLHKNDDIILIDRTITILFIRTVIG